MPHDVFISYSSQDKPIADAVTATLEQRKIRCWVAPRDVLPGVPYGEAIIDALENSRAMVLIFSASANTSPQVMREVERAVSKGVTIIPFRIEDVTPSKSMEYFISAPHWLDAWSPPLEVHTNRLADAIRRLLGIADVAPAAQMPAAQMPAAQMPTAQEIPATRDVPTTQAAPIPQPTLSQAAPAEPAPAYSAPTGVAAAVSPLSAAATPPASGAKAAAAASEAADTTTVKPKLRWWMIGGGVAAVAIIAVVAVLLWGGGAQTPEEVADVPNMAVDIPQPGPCDGITQIIRRGTDGAVADAYIWLAEPDSTHDYDTLYTGMYDTGLKQTLIHFDLGAIPRNAQVLKAMFFINLNGGNQPRPVAIHHITREWEESSVTWNSFQEQFDRDKIWATFESGEPGWRIADITTLVQAWLHGDLPNLGLLLDDVSAKNPDQYETYYASETDAVDLRPRLEICLKQ